MQQKMSQLRQEQIQPLSKVCQQKYLIQLCIHDIVKELTKLPVLKIRENRKLNCSDFPKIAWGYGLKNENFGGNFYPQYISVSISCVRDDEMRRLLSHLIADIREERRC